jgi:hypothetical protein
MAGHGHVEDRRRWADSRRRGDRAWIQPDASMHVTRVDKWRAHGAQEMGVGQSQRDGNVECGQVGVGVAAGRGMRRSPPTGQEAGGLSADSHGAQALSGRAWVVLGVDFDELVSTIASSTDAAKSL